MSNETNFEFNCPVCLEVPKDEIYQCVNGHIVCRSCFTILKECPQCREPYGKKKIRTLALEQILDSRKFDCPNKLHGCPDTTFRKELNSHGKTCSFRGVQVHLCKHLGYSCDYEMDSRNVQDIIRHFEKKHGALKMKFCRRKVQLVDFLSTNSQKSTIWTPSIYQNHNVHFLIFAKVNGSSLTLSLHCIVLEDHLPRDIDYKVKFTVSTEKKNRVLEYTTSPVDLTEVEDFVGASTCQIPVETLKKHYATEEGLTVIVWIQLNKNEDGGNPNLVSTDEGDIILAISESLWNQGAPGGLSDEGPVFNMNCNNCNTVPIHGIYHSCLECDAYDLCNTCRDRNVHSHHSFAKIENVATHISSIKARWNKERRDWVAVLQEYDSPIWCVLCKNIGVNESATRVCLDCESLQAYCNTCINTRPAKKQCSGHKTFRF